MKPLNEITVGQRVRVSDVTSTGAMRRRLQDLGVIKGTHIECLQKSPKGDPIAYLIRGAAIALRNEDANNIICESL